MPHVDEGSLHAYLDGELPSAECKTLEAHVAECAGCRAMLAEERALIARASDLLGSARPAEHEIPPFEALPVRRRRSPWRVRTPVAWAASIALAVGLGYYLHQPTTEPEHLAPTQSERHDVALNGNRPEERLPARRNTNARPAAPSAKPIPRAPAPAPATDVAAAVPAAAEQKVERDSTAGGMETNRAPAAVAQRFAAPSAVAASGAATRELADVRSRATTTSWPIISRGAAQSLLGTDPVGVPGLARKIRRSPAADGTVVVEQQVDSATTIQIFQRQAADAPLDSSSKVDRLRIYRAPAATPTGRLARYVGRLRVEIAGPLSVDSLNRLLEQVQPLP